jgi:hypothetical protein
MPLQDSNTNSGTTKNNIQNTLKALHCIGWKYHDDNYTLVFIHGHMLSKTKSGGIAFFGKQS